MNNYTPTIGTDWLNHHGRLCRVFDIYVTTNSAGIEVERRYVSYYLFAGQRVESIDNQVTVGKGMHKLAQREIKA